jgi:hypothetical protein
MSFRLGQVASAVAAGSLFLAGTVTTVSSASMGPAFMRERGGLTLVSQRTLSHGIVLTTWRDGSATVAFAGPAHSTVRASSGGGSGSPGYAWASIDPSGSASGSSGGSAGSPSVTNLSLTPEQGAQLMFEEAVAVGTPVAVARKMAFGSFGPAHPSSTSGIRLSLTSNISNGTIFNSTCDHVTGDANDAYGTSCLVQMMSQDDEPNGVYVLDKITTSGNDNDWFCNLSGLRGNDYYRYSNSYGQHGIVSWKPASSYPEGTPTTVSFSMSYNGVGISSSQTVYPGQVDPYFANYNGSYPTSFGAKWSGSVGGSTVVGNPAVDLAHVWDSGSIDAGDFVEIWWC